MITDCQRLLFTIVATKQSGLRLQHSFQAASAAGTFAWLITAWNPIVETNFSHFFIPGFMYYLTRIEDTGPLATLVFGSMRSAIRLRTMFS
ncbi:hypothetical protein W823_23545 [Williamsia sp. D3]|nr:hypothetical protein W823_23545 [Williamsia sp. D3]